MFRTIAGKPRFCVALIAQIEIFAVYGQYRAVFALKTAHQGPAHHAAMTGNPNALSRKRKNHRGG